MNDKRATGTGKAQEPSRRRAAGTAFDPFFARAWLDFMSDRTAFAMQRLRHDLEWQRAILTCRTPMEAGEVNSEFARVAMQHYAAEVGRLWTVLSKVGEGFASEARASHARGYDDLPL